MLVGGLKPSQIYWYRFTDTEGNGSRVGRTITAPLANDPRPINFAFVSCQSVNEGKLNAYRRMIFEDEQKPPAEQLGFVLHLGDFIYEVVEYPDEVKTRYDRIIYDVGRIPDGGKFSNFHYPLTLDGYRVVYKGYLADPDLQDARARWPFVSMWDNHEFSWQGWQSIQQAGGPPNPGQTIKVAANQAWFEFIPARVKAPSGSLDTFGSVPVSNVKIEKWDGNGLGDEPNNLAAINSLKGYRALRYGKHLDLIITDQHSYRSADPFSDDSLNKLGDWAAFNGMFPDDLQQVLDGGRAFNGGNPPAELAFGESRIREPAKGCAAADDPRRRAESVVQGPAQARNRDMENLGQFAGRARHARRPAEPSGGSRQGLACRLRKSRRRRPWHRLDRTRRDLRLGAGRQDHRLCDRVWRPPQLLGRICRGAAPPGQV